MSSKMLHMGHLVSLSPVEAAKRIKEAGSDCDLRYNEKLALKLAQLARRRGRLWAREFFAQF